MDTYEVWILLYEGDISLSFRFIRQESPFCKAGRILGDSLFRYTDIAVSRVSRKDRSSLVKADKCINRSCTYVSV